MDYTITVRGYEFKVQFSKDWVRVHAPIEFGEIVEISWVALREHYGAGPKAIDKFVGRYIGEWLAFA